MKNIDLHIHTHFSDGDHSIEEVFKKARAAGLTTIAVTDHNWPHYKKDNRKKALEFELDLIQGIEITAIFEEKSIHILGYSRNFDLKKLSDGLQAQNDGYNQRSKIIVERINRSGKIKIDFRQIRKKYKGCIQNLPILVEVGKALNKLPSEDETMTYYKQFRIPCGNWAMTAEEVIELIHRSGGVAVLAHPATHWKKIGQGRFNRLFKILLKAGLDGVEASHSDQSEEEETKIIALAEKHDLLVTGGSDFHGEAIAPQRKLGEKGIDEEQLAKIIKKLDSINGSH